MTLPIFPDAGNDLYAPTLGVTLQDSEAMVVGIPKSMTLAATLGESQAMIRATLPAVPLDALMASDQAARLEAQSSITLSVGPALTTESNIEAFATLLFAVHPAEGTKVLGTEETDLDVLLGFSAEANIQAQASTSLAAALAADVEGFAAILPFLTLPAGLGDVQSGFAAIDLSSSLDAALGLSTTGSLRILAALDLPAGFDFDSERLVQIFMPNLALPANVSFITTAQIAAVAGVELEAAMRYLNVVARPTKFNSRFYVVEVVNAANYVVLADSRYFVELDSKQDDQ